MSRRRQKGRSPAARLVLIEWADSCSVRGVWKNPSDLDAVAKTCFTVGWVVKESRRAITVVGTASLNDEDAFDHIAGDMTIPKGCIVRTRTLSRSRL